MGISTYALFTTNNLRFTISKLPTKIKEYFGWYFRQLDNNTDIESFIYLFNNPNFSKLMGYFNKEKLNAWEGLFKGIMKQNSQIIDLEIHFTCSELGLTFYFYIYNGEFGIRLGEENDLRYNDIVYSDFNNNIVSKAIYEADPNNHMSSYVLNLEKYKMSYYEFTEEHEE
jgi:hypothetical protein